MTTYDLYQLDRNGLETEALRSVDTEMYYELMDAMTDMSDAELRQVIKGE